MSDALPPPAADAGRSRIDLQGIQDAWKRVGPLLTAVDLSVEAREGDYIQRAWRAIPDLLAEVLRLSVERDEREQGTLTLKRLLLHAYQHNATAYDERDKARARVASLLQRLRAQEQQWRESASYEAENANVQYGQALDQCANDLASLLAASEGEP